MSPTLPRLGLAALLLLGGCALGPDYQRPAVEIPATFREAEGWKRAEPADHLPAGPWWTRYQDPLLNELVPQVDLANQDLRFAEARYREALALLGGARAELLPQVGADLSAIRSRAAGSGDGGRPPVRASQRLALSASWEVDLWGRLGRQVEAGSRGAEARAADLAAARLSAQAALVHSYLQLRVVDAQGRLLARSIEAYRRSLEITRNRRQAGVASRADVAQAETVLLATQAQAIDLGIRRAELEHAIAVLLGKPPAALRLAAEERVPGLPAVPPQLPSALLERRPDIAAAERRVAADNARIGVARAAYFPSLSLGASAGTQGSSLADLLALPHHFWALGPALAQTLFDGGARQAASDQALAAFDASVADYRQTVLVAFQETEGALASLRVLAEEEAVQAAATVAANEFLSLTTNQYLAGTVSYLNVAIAQTAALNAERASLELLGRELAASVSLVRALGGDDWERNPPPRALAATP